ncbi:hypothetical protein An09g04750 [Aspergillus niger]|uniref:Uncharacterized protein n=2 Tax=Aspergillus niger TaxID=5061 RepID=A2QU86_ASPNC|nr:hypothetical protein An09g04750 [Aspergillus niger]CAK40329.1 hypothetical protein An09g04750 [Aspergillus niger]
MTDPDLDGHWTKDRRFRHPCQVAGCGKAAPMRFDAVQLSNKLCPTPDKSRKELNQGTFLPEPPVADLRAPPSMLVDDTGCSSDGPAAYVCIRRLGSLPSPVPHWESQTSSAALVAVAQLGAESSGVWGTICVTVKAEELSRIERGSRGVCWSYVNFLGVIQPSSVGSGIEDRIECFRPGRQIWQWGSRISCAHHREDHGAGGSVVTTTQRVSDSGNVDRRHYHRHAVSEKTPSVQVRS